MTPVDRVTAAKTIIKSFVIEKRYADAAFSAHDPLDTVEGRNYMFKVVKIGNVCLTDDQRYELEGYCTQLGFDAKMERKLWFESNYERVMKENVFGTK